MVLADGRETEEDNAKSHAVRHYAARRKKKKRERCTKLAHFPALLAVFDFSFSLAQMYISFMYGRRTYTTENKISIEDITEKK